MIIDDLSLTSGTTSLEEDATFGVDAIVYPNPAMDYLMVKGPKLTDYSVELHNGKGQKLKSVIGAENLKMNVSDIAKGVYYVKIERIDNSHSVIKSVVIE